MMIVTGGGGCDEGVLDGEFRRTVPEEVDSVEKDSVRGGCVIS